MSTKLQFYSEFAERMARQITGSYRSWTAFLATTARLYKYPYNEQLMIYAQRPNATACAEYDFWKDRMGRYGHERDLLAEALLHLRGDLSDDARKQGYLSCLQEYRGSFSKALEKLSAALKNPTFRQNLSDEYAAFWTAYEQDKDLLRFHYHKLWKIRNRLKDLSLPRCELSDGMTEVPSVAQFITEDEISHTLMRSSGVEGGKNRIFAYFTEAHTDIVKKVIRMKFAEIAAAPESEILNHQHKKEIELARIKLDQANAHLAEKQKDLSDYKAETLKVIRGQSNLSVELLNALVKETETMIALAQTRIDAAQTEYESLLASAENLRQEYDRLLTWADLFDTCSFEAKKMIVAQFVKAVRVSRDYNIEIDFNVSFEEFQNFSVKNGEPVILQPLRSYTA